MGMSTARQIRLIEHQQNEEFEKMLYSTDSGKEFAKEVADALDNVGTIIGRIKEPRARNMVLRTIVRRWMDSSMMKNAFDNVGKQR